MLEFKDDDSYRSAILHFGYTKSKMIENLCESVMTEDVCSELPEILGSRGIETTAAQVRNQTAVIAGKHASDLKDFCFKIANQVSNGMTPAAAVMVLEEKHISILKNLAIELQREYGDRSPKYHDAMAEYMSLCMNLSPHEMIPESRNHRNSRLNELLEDKRLTAWRGVFKNDDWSEAAVLHEIDGGLSDVVYEALRQTRGDKDEALDVVMICVQDEFFNDYLLGELEHVAKDRLKPNDDLAALLGTTPEVVNRAFNRLANRIVQRVTDLSDEMQAETPSDIF